MTKIIYWLNILKGIQTLIEYHKLILELNAILKLACRWESDSIWSFILHVQRNRNCIVLIRIHSFSSYLLDVLFVQESLKSPCFLSHPKSKIKKWISSEISHNTKSWINSYAHTSFHVACWLWLFILYLQKLFNAMLLVHPTKLSYPNPGAKTLIAMTATHSRDKPWK